MERQHQLSNGYIFFNLFLIFFINFEEKKIRYKNDAKIKPDKRLVTKVEDKTFSLTIIGAKAADVGLYKAVIKNKIGQVESRHSTLSISSKNYFNNKNFQNKNEDVLFCPNKDLLCQSISN